MSSPFDRTTLAEKMDSLVSEMDQAYAAIRKILMDPEYLNKSSQENRVAQDDFRAIQERIWLLKEAWGRPLKKVPQ